MADIIVLYNLYVHDGLFYFDMDKYECEHTISLLHPARFMCCHTSNSKHSVPSKPWWWSLYVMTFDLICYAFFGCRRMGLVGVSADQSSVLGSHQSPLRVLRNIRIIRKLSTFPINIRGLFLLQPIYTCSPGLCHWHWHHSVISQFQRSSPDEYGLMN